MSRHIIPITPEKLKMWKSYLEPVTFNQIRRKKGKYYLKFCIDSTHRHEQFIVKFKDLVEFALRHKIYSPGQIYTLRGRLLEFITLNIIFDILAPYANDFPKVPIRGGSVPDIVRACFLNPNHRLYDIYIPFLDLYIDCKHRSLKVRDYERSMSSARRNVLVAHLNDADRMINADLAQHYPRMKIIYLCGYVSTPIVRGSELNPQMNPAGLDTSMSHTGGVEMGRDFFSGTRRVRIDAKGRTYSRIFDLDLDWVSFRRELRERVEQDIATRHRTIRNQER